MRVLVALLPVIALASSLTWYPLNQAKALIKSSRKIMMVEITSPTCHYCLEMDATTFKDPAVIKRLTESFIPVRLSRGDDDIPDDFYARGTPTFFFIDATGRRIVPPIFGAWPAHDFLDILDDVKAKGALK